VIDSLPHFCANSGLQSNFWLGLLRSPCVPRDEQLDRVPSRHFQRPGCLQHRALLHDA
jgi:hypothetical protein